jgi:hypothetical protein
LRVRSPEDAIRRPHQLCVFGPFLRRIVAAGVAQGTLGASINLVVFNVVMLSAMYRLVME